MIDLTQLVTRADKDAKAAAAVQSAMAAVLIKYRADREAYLNRLAGIGLAAQVGGDTITVQHILAVRKGLLELTDDPAVLAATDVAGLETVLLTAYYALLMGVPESLKSVFRAGDQ